MVRGGRGNKEAAEFMPAASPSNSSKQNLNHLELIGFLGIDVHHVHGTGQSGIE